MENKDSRWRKGTGPGLLWTDDACLVDRRVLKDVRRSLVLRGGSAPGECEIYSADPEHTCETCGEVDCFRMARLYELDLAMAGTSKLALHKLTPDTKSPECERAAKGGGGGD